MNWQSLILIFALVAMTGCSASWKKNRERYRSAAFEIAASLQTHALERPEGKVWAQDPTDPSTAATDLYYGSAGVVLFFLEAYRASGRTAYLDEARAGADYLVATLPESLKKEEFGLYLGVGGIGFVLTEVHRATDDPRYLDGATRCVDLLKAHAQPTTKGVTWDGVTDIISGSAGTGLCLLHAADHTGHPDALDLAVEAGHGLVARKIPQETGCKWEMESTFPRLMPNFSHGTAGVAYFLVELYRATGDEVFLETALEGAAYLRSVMKEDGLIFHHEPDGEDLFYLGWCHGPAGTARLYYRLWQVTGDASWMEMIHRAAHTIMESGIPEKKTPGFWNNVSQCCGTAGVAEFFHVLYRVTDRSKYRDFAHHLADDLLAHIDETEEGLWWTQAEHRVKPDLLIAQSGYMQGSAGMGVLLLHLGAPGDPEDRLLLPDSPW